MEQFNRGARLQRVKELKKNRKHYWGGWAADPKQQGRVSQYPAICSCAKCCNSGSRLNGNSKFAHKPQDRAFWELNPIE